MNAPTLLTEKEAATILRVGRNAVKNLLPRIRLSKRGTRYDLRDIERLIKSGKEF